MKTNRAFKYELDPNRGQLALLAKHAGTARFAYNRGLARKKEVMEYVKEAGTKERVLSATVSRTAGRWYVSFAVEHEIPGPVPVQGPVVGIDCFAVLSDGTEVRAPKPLQEMLARLHKLSKRLSRKKKGSSNRKKAAMRVARLHRRIVNIRNDFLHKLSTDLAKTRSMVVLEDLNVKGMVRNRHLARHIADAGWGRFREMMKYKTSWYGSMLLTAPAFFPSTKTCSVCGSVKDMPLKERTFECV